MVLPLPGSSFGQIKHLPGVQVPHEGLEDLGSLWVGSTQRAELAWGLRNAGQGLFELEISVCEVTWFPPLFGLTNTSSGFMSCEGMGLTKKGFQRPSVT